MLLLPHPASTNLKIGDFSPVEALAAVSSQVVQDARNDARDVEIVVRVKRLQPAHVQMRVRCDVHLYQAGTKAAGEWRTGK